MFNEESTVIHLLNTLVLDLRKSGNDARGYFEELRDSLLASSDQKQKSELLLRLKSGAKIVDYANFSPKQEAIWNELWQEVTRLLQN
jgi:hypothetical protein